MFDIEMPNHHNFFANGILAHNCHEVDFLSPDGQYMRIINEMILRNAKNDRKMRIIGMTGSPYRGVKDIIGPFWKSCVFKVRTPYLVEREYLVRTLFGFGHDETQYDLSEFKIDENDDHSDYTKDQLDQMQKKIVADKKVTQLIVEEVVKLTAHRNAVMITGAGKKHLMQVAEFLPEDSWVIITDSTGNRERRISLKQVYDGKKKFVLQIGCLTTGIDIPLIDTSVIMRKIGSLTLLVQLLGRGMRLLKPFQKEAGIIKDDHLVLDYSGTMAEMADIYDDPVLEKAALDKAKQDDADMVICGACQTKNSPRAQRCVGRIEDGDDTRMFQVMRTTRDGLPVHNFSLDGRCENFFNSKECPFCGTPNSNSARECRQCEGMLVDPSKNLSARHYVDEDFRGVLDMKLALTKNAKGIVVTYIIDGPVLNEGAKTVNFFGESREVAVEIFHPHGAEKWMKLKWIQFVEQHTTTSARKLLQGKSAVDIVKLSNLITKPSQITHRVNSDGKSIVYRRR